jgi:hypothetical protein
MATIDAPHCFAPARDFAGTRIELIVLDAEVGVAAKAVGVSGSLDPDAVLVRLESLLCARYPRATVVVHRHPRLATPPAVTGGPAPERVSADLEELFGRLLQRAALVTARETGVAQA